MLNRVIYAIAAMAMCCATVQAQELPEGYKALCIKEQGSDKTTEFQLHEIEEIVFENRLGYAGHQCVDLGLESGNMWATMNVGAEEDGEYGDHISWGEIEEQDDRFSWDTYKFGTKTSLTKYNAIDGLTTLEAEDDAAVSRWGNGWKTPTEADWEELFNGCEKKDIERNGRWLVQLTSTSNGNSIILPLSGRASGGIWSSAESRGYYWASGVDDEFEAVCAEIGRYIEPSVFSIARYNGCSVRPLINLGNDKLEEYRAMLVKTKGKTIEFDLRKVAEVTLEYRAYEQRDYVDLGLTSGMLWATTNIGAEAPEDFGDYYAWGEVQTKRLYEYYTYRYGEDMKEMTKYCTDSEYGKDGFTDGLTALEADDDAAIRLWGKGWRMPEAKDFDELIAECNWEWTELNGVFGYMVTSRVNENSIFLPAAGCIDLELYLDETGTYWSSSLDQEYSNSAHALRIKENRISRSKIGQSREFGYSIRPVHPKLEE